MADSPPNPPLKQVDSDHDAERRTAGAMTTMRLPRLLGLLVLFGLLGPSLAHSAHAQGEYRNLDAGFPVRVEDATVTERYALDLDFMNFRYDELSALRTRFQYEPQVSYGILPRTEMWIRLPIYYRERGVTPRKGVAGIGVGGMYQLTLETLSAPALAVASEIFIPTGPGALPASYSLKTLFTHTLSTARVHFNAGVSSFAVRPAAIRCLALPGGSVCGGQGGPSLPPLDGPCTIGSQSSVAPLMALCAAPEPASIASETQLMAASPGIVTHAHWTVGMAMDRAFALQSVLLVADAFAERFEAIGRKTDYTAEVGMRKQLSPRIVFAGGVGRHFRGTNPSSFLVLGATYSRALQGFWRHL